MKELRRVKTWGGFYKGLAVCAACLLFLSAGITGLAARTGTVQSDNVNVRKEASAGSDRVCQLSAGTSVTVVDETQGEDGNTWYNVSFTNEGAETSGWIRADMLSVSETEEPEGGEGGSQGGASVGGYTILEPEEAYGSSDGLQQSAVWVGDQSFTAWQVSTDRTGGAELYLVYASREDGSSGWYCYDPQEGTFQRDMGQFSGGAGEGQEPEGLIDALQGELTQLKEDQEKQLSQRLYIIIGLGVLSAVLLILVIVFAVKYRNSEYEYYDDEDEEDDIPVRRRKSSAGTEESEEPGSDFDEFVAAVRKKWSEDDDYEDDDYEDDDYEDDDYYDEDEYPDEEDEYPDEDGEYPEDEYEEYEDEEPDQGVPGDTIELPEIDMSAILEIEEEAKGQSKKRAADEEDMDEFDIEILDFDDLDI